MCYVRSRSHGSSQLNGSEESDANVDYTLSIKADSLPLEKPRRGAPIIDRIMWKIIAHPGKLDTPCWLWTGSCSNGYGQLSVSTDGKRRMIYVHRWLYEHDVGPISPGHVLHHKCDTPHCVNPAHLEPMTQRRNICQFTTKQTIANMGTR